MGAALATNGGRPRTRKGATRDADGNVTDCLFCRIASGREGNPLWYRDDRVAVFATRTPAARLHLLVVPSSQHVGDLDSLGPAHGELLLHMMAVAREQLAAHGPRADRPQPPRAPPPAYPFNRGRLGDHDDGSSGGGKGGGGAATGVGASTGTDAAPTRGGSGDGLLLAPAPPPPSAAAAAGFDPSAARLAFHRPPFNSIEHLHLHALYGPWASCWDSITFAHGAPWHAGVEEALLRAGVPSQVAAAHATWPGHAAVRDGAAGRRRHPALDAGRLP